MDDIHKYGVPLSAALASGRFDDVLTLQKIAKANAEIEESKTRSIAYSEIISAEKLATARKETVDWANRTIFSAHWEAIVRRLRAPTDNEQHLYLFARPSPAMERKLYPDAAWDHALYYDGPEYRNIRFEGGETIYDVILLDQNAAKLINLSVSSKKQNNSRPKREGDVGGRTPKYDWLSFDKEMMRIADTPDGLPAKRELVKIMTDWICKWDQQPNESQIRNRVAKLYPK